MDVAWNRTAALWGAYDRESDTIYFYSCHYRGEAEPPIHASAILGRGNWIPGRIDPVAGGRSQADGKQLLKTYQSLGLTLQMAPNAVEAGLYEVWTRLSTGRIKVFRSLQSVFEELRVYRRDDKGRVVKERDHLMDAMRYYVLACVNTKFAWLKTQTPRRRPRDTYRHPFEERAYDPLGWMA